MQKGTIILLNGVSSSGKTTLSKEIIRLLPDYFHLSIDDFDLLIEKKWKIGKWPAYSSAHGVFFHQTVAMFSDRGTNVVVDQALRSRLAMDDCFKVLRGHPMFFVGVHCPLQELERKEQEKTGN